ncbi:hypothetical protein O181_121144 [Austropuccinia psidii MF-1]|uniref:Uncharacterized protein n=1 Tax=Austropuccinia psidii MF-1 TaxID=1389203 RepID=A0A9Q3KI23_9BASI|nr:hypothetical protein [Austropuccinia psidii MF-1]
MKESGHESLYIADFRSLISVIGDWEERAYIHVYRRRLASRFLDQLASYPGNFDTLQELMDITLELDTRYHERQKEKGSHQEKKLLVTGSNHSRPPRDLFSKRPHHKKNEKGNFTTMAIHLLGSPYGISSHSPFMANWPYPSPVANMAT